MRNIIVRPILLIGLLSVSLLTAFGLTKPGRSFWHRLSHTKRVSRPVAKKPVIRALSTTLLPYKFGPAAQPVEVFALSDSGQHWVDSVFHSLTPEQKVGQFFMVATFSNRHENHYQYIDHLIQNNNIGGLIFFQGVPIGRLS